MNEIRTLYDASRWEDVVRAATGGSGAPADADYYRGMALARLERWSEARAAFLAGAKQAPRDPRFYAQLAGVAYRVHDLRESCRNLHRALALRPGDEYANDFLGSIYFLEGNLEAALKYWNRAGKPRIANVVQDPRPRVDAVLLDRAFAFSSAAVLRADELLDTRARLDLLRIFSSYRLELQSREDESFDVRFQAVDRNAWRTSRLAGVLSMLRGLPFQEIHPEAWNVAGAGVNFVSTARWDSQKRRVAASVAAPLHHNPALRFRLFLDGRDENWDLRGVLRAAGPAGDVKLRKLEAGAELEQVVNARWRWGVRAYLSHRTFRGASFTDPAAAAFFRPGLAVHYEAHTTHTLLRLPERRLSVSAAPSLDFGRLFGMAPDAAPSSRSAAFLRAQASLDAKWFPAASGDDYETTLRLRGGRTWGQAPFDELFMLGVERDSDLGMRGHAGTRDGKKGGAPLGRDYVLLNLEADKQLWKQAFFTVKAGPFLDTGMIRDASGVFGSGGWMCDAGARVTVRLLGGVGVSLSYGRDLRGGRHALFANIQ